MTKVISISDNAYEELSRIKNGFSFSEIIIDLTRKIKEESLMNFAGKLDKSEAEKMLKEIKRGRKEKSRRI